MSSEFVRSAIREQWPVLLPTVPLFETINDSPSNLEVEIPIWATLAFDVSSRTNTTMGSRPWIEEDGVVSVMIMSYSGTGDDEITPVADEIVKAWEMWIDDTKNLWVQSVDGPRPPDPEAAGDVYRLLVNLNYRYQTRGGS